MATFLQDAVTGARQLQALKADKMALEQAQKQQAGIDEASGLLKQYYDSQKAGKPNQELLISATLKSPQLAGQMLDVMGLTDKQEQQRVAGDVSQLYMASQDPQTFFAQASKLRNQYMQEGRDVEDIDEIAIAYKERGPEAALQMMKVLAAPLEAKGYKTGVFAEQAEAMTPYQQASLAIREREAKAAEARAARPDTQITIDNKQDTEIAKMSAKDYQNLIGRATAANKELATISTLEKLSDKAFSGAGAGALMQGAKILNQLGIETEGLKESEVYEKLANTLVLDKSQQMSGALSNADMTFLQNTVPSLNTSKEGRKLTFDISRKLAEREKQVAKLATEYRRKNNGRFDSGEFQIYLDEWKDANPLFPEVAASQARQQNVVSWDSLPTGGN